jgi:16S rRNA (adenine1518-N6/adenine1519-N6)-dimethyltransferase
VATIRQEAMIRPHAQAPARKRFGQHFLERAWAAKVLDAIAPTPEQTFLEIGPGRGAITGLLAAAARHVIAFEIDRDMAASLRDAALSNVRIVGGDFLEITAEQVRQELATVDSSSDTLRVVGNLPYNVASPILFKLVELFDQGMAIADATVMLQREVANRLLASPGTKDYGVLTILIARHAQVDRLLQLPAGAFRPAPKVQSTLLRLRFHSPEPPVKSDHVFEALTQAIFTRRRKTLANALLAYAPVPRQPAKLLELAEIEPQRRPETLTIPELARLADVLTVSVGSEDPILPE